MKTSNFIFSSDHAIPDTRMEGVEFSLLRLDGPFCLTVPATPTVDFYLVRRGRVLFESNGAVPTRAELTPDTCVGISGRIPHTLSSIGLRESSDDPPTQVLHTEPFGTPDRGESVEMVVSSVPEEAILYACAFQDIPIIFPDTSPRLARSIRRAVDWIEEESIHRNANRQDHAASAAIIRRLAEIITFEMVRFNLLQQPELASTLHAAHTDKRILRVLTAMYREPERQWSLQSLADEACMSRTAFAARYRELMGTTPLSSLQRLRLKRAADQLLHGSGESVEKVAMTWGYSSAAVFIRAFTREFGKTPGRWREHAEQPVTALNETRGADAIRIPAHEVLPGYAHRSTARH